MKVLILGWRRYLGPRLVKQLLDRGHEPVIFNRGRCRAPLPVHEPVREILGDRNDGEALGNLVAGESFDAVVDTLAFDSESAQRAVDVLAGHVGRYLVISSVACYGRQRYAPADEQHPYVDDNHRFPGANNNYATGKRDAERVVWKAYQRKQFPAIIIRPSVSYGYGRLFSIWGYCNRHVSRIRAGKPVIVPDTGESLIQPIFIDDEAEIIARALECEAAIGEAFNCAGPRAVPLWQYFRAHGTVIDKDVQCVELPARYLVGFDPVRCTRASGNLIFNHAYDVSKLKRMLNFEHRYGLEEGLARTIEFQDRWDLMEPTREGDPDDLLIENYHPSHAMDMETVGQQVREQTGYQLVESSPLVKWAPDHYRLDS